MASHTISMQGIGAAHLSAKAGAAVTAGYPCHFTGNDTVANSASGGEFCGVIEGVRSGLVTVQYHGFVTLPYSGTAPAVGYGILAADGTGGVKTATSGRSYLIVHVDTAAKTLGLML